MQSDLATGAAAAPDAAPWTTARGRRPPPRWLAPVVLAIPFVVTIALLRGLTHALTTFHSTDELAYHVPTILQFAHQLPGVDLVHYPAAQTPLFHLLLALAGKVVGFELWRLRLLNAAISYALALALYALLRRVRGLTSAQAAMLSLLFVLSPYVFGPSFLLLTDNLALLLAIAAIGALEAYRRDPRTARFALACGLAGAAVLTRQSFLWLVPLSALWAIRARPPAPAPAARQTGGLAARLSRSRPLAAAGAALALALVPFALLAHAWGGLEPPTADPRSCGLCTSGSALDAVSLRPVAFTVAIVGLYGALLAPTLLGDVRRTLTRSVCVRRAGAAALAGVALLLLAPLAPQRTDAGFLWKLSAHGPTLLGTSWPFWLLVPTGCVVLALARRRGDVLPYAVFGLFLASTVATGLLYQKYFDPLALLTLILLMPPRDSLRPRDVAGPAVLAAAFVAYAVSLAT